MLLWIGINTEIKHELVIHVPIVISHQENLVYKLINIKLKKKIRHEKNRNRLSIILLTIKQIANQSLKSWSIHHGIYHYSKKKWGQKNCWGQIWVQVNFWGQAKISVKAKIEAKNEVRPTLGQGQARFYNMPPTRKKRTYIRFYFVV